MRECPHSVRSCTEYLTLGIDADRMAYIIQNQIDRGKQEKSLQKIDRNLHHRLVAILRTRIFFFSQQNSGGGSLRSRTTAYGLQE
jgi:hypothetical protein